MIIVSKLDDTVTIVSSNGVAEERIVISYYHQQDCCEHVYLDLDPLLGLRTAVQGDDIIKSLRVIEVADQGIIFDFKTKNLRDKIKIFCPAYDYQNGYYGSDLELTVRINEEEDKFDITGCTEADGY